MEGISLETRKIVDFSFKLGFLFSETISDLKEILLLSNSNDFIKVKTMLEQDFEIRFKTIEYFFQKLLENHAIVDDDFKYIKIFTENSAKIINDTINEIKNTGKLDIKKISLLKRLLKDLSDY